MAMPPVFDEVEAGLSLVLAPVRVEDEGELQVAYELSTPPLDAFAQILSDLSLARDGAVRPHRGPVGDRECTAQEAANQLRTTYTQANAELNGLKQIRSDVLDVASFYRIKEAFDRAKTRMAGGALAAAIGITAFAWGANPPKSTSLSAGDVLPKTPSNVTVILKKKGIARYGASVRNNKKCNLSNLPAIALAVSRTSYTVVTVATKNCRVRRMTVTAARGRVIPRIKGP